MTQNPTDKNPDYATVQFCSCCILYILLCWRDNGFKGFVFINVQTLVRYRMLHKYLRICWQFYFRCSVEITTTSYMLFNCSIFSRLEPYFRFGVNNSYKQCLKSYSQETSAFWVWLMCFAIVSLYLLFPLHVHVT